MKSLFLFSAIILLTVAGCNNSNSNKSSIDEPETKLGWTLGAGTYTFNRFTFLQSLDKIDSCNLKYVECFPGQVIGEGIEGTMDYHMNATTQKEILKKVGEKGMKIIAYGVITPNSDVEWRKLFDFGKSMGIQTFTSEPDEKDLAFISGLCDEYGINVAIHNHPYPKHYWNPDTVLAALKGRSNRIGACADIGHWVRSDLDPIECLKKLEGHVLHVHMKDLEAIEGKDTGEENRDVHWGTGVANTDGVIKELKRQNFKGMISAEYERNWENNTPDVMASVKYFRNALR
ncbi:MAG TPA: sugar phosphate isomerase/epimerase [Chitinophagaceae bacterium]|nr:sugar phosphate isomerase/epimerase [Chitinophagaceae bacterium]